MRWCKVRALEYARRGDKTNTLASMCSDLAKHAETAPLQQMAFMMGMVLTESVPELVRYVEGFAE